jgi:hypothetical protein
MYVGITVDILKMMHVVAKVAAAAADVVVVMGLAIRWHSLNSRMRIRKIRKKYQKLPPQEISVEEMPAHILVAVVMAVDEVDSLS